MGASSYDAASFSRTLSDASARGASVFSHTTSVRSGHVAAKVHELLDPSRKNKAGKIVREARDSDVHPTTVPVAMLFDVTGSMSTVPQTFVQKLPALMQTLVKKGYLEHPQILFGAIGDATCDRAPLQIGQFEGGNEMDTAITNILLEGGGGGQQTESYELAMFFMARYTELDSLQRSGKKGYLFLTGDELPYSRVKKSEVKEFIGVDIGEDIPTLQILDELREKFEVFWILPGLTSNFNDPRIREPLKKMFGQHLIVLDDPEAIVETIATAIGAAEGFDGASIAKDLRDAGSSAGLVDAASTALANYTGGTVARGAKVDGDLPVTANKTDSAGRL